MKAYPVTVLCRVMKISRSGFYQYRRHYGNQVQDPEQTALEFLMRSIFNASKATYGNLMSPHPPAQRRLSKELLFSGNVNPCLSAFICV